MRQDDAARTVRIRRSHARRDRSFIDRQQDLTVIINESNCAPLPYKRSSYTNTVYATTFEHARAHAEGLAGSSYCRVAH
jgi:hypothetical protein